MKALFQEDAAGGWLGAELAPGCSFCTMSAGTSSSSPGNQLNRGGSGLPGSVAGVGEKSLQDNDYRRAPYMHQLMHAHYSSGYKLDRAAVRHMLRQYLSARGG